jgi:WD40 repeat protein
LKKIDQDLDKHTSHGLTVAFKGKRPFKVFTGSEDTKVNFYKGPPFNYEKTIEGAHSRFVNVIRNHPNGEDVVSSGSDQSLIVYDAATGDIKEKKEKIHNGSIYSLTFFDGGNKFVTCSADKTVKVWQWEGLELLHTLNIAPKPGVGDMQVGVTVTEQYIISLSLSGVLNFWNLEGLDGESVAAPDFVQAGHRKNVIQVWFNEGQLISVDTEGRVLKFNNLADNPTFHDFGKSVKQANFTPCGKFLAVSSSDKVLIYNTENFEQTAEIKADGFINKLFLLTQEKVAIVTNKSTFTVYEGGEESGVVKLGEEGISLSISEDETTGYVGSNVSLSSNENMFNLKLERYFLQDQFG